MLNPSDGVSGITRFVLESVASAGGNPCPPVIVGLGIGGTADMAAKLSKKALLRRIPSGNADIGVARLEKSFGVDKQTRSRSDGPWRGYDSPCSGMPGYAFCHTASLPVAVQPPVLG